MPWRRFALSIALVARQISETRTLNINLIPPLVRWVKDLLSVILFCGILFNCAYVATSLSATPEPSAPSTSSDPRFGRATKRWQYPRIMSGYELYILIITLCIFLITGNCPVGNWQYLIWWHFFDLGKSLRLHHLLHNVEDFQIATLQFGLNSLQ